jgi:hypothetical protein
MLLLLFCFVAFALAQNVTMTDDDVVETLEDACCDAIQKILYDQFISDEFRCKLYLKFYETRKCCDTLNWYLDESKNSDYTNGSEFVFTIVIFFTFVLIGLFAVFVPSQRR